MKSLAELEAQVVLWAEEKGILAAGNKVAQATKTLEEISEAKEEMRALKTLIALRSSGGPHKLAMELGDILVTLCIQCELLGSKLSDARWTTPVKTEKPPEPSFENIDLYATHFWNAINDADSNLCPLESVGRLYMCVWDAAQNSCYLSPEECLDMALKKIQRRTGIMVGGVFVKAT